MICLGDANAVQEGFKVHAILVKNGCFDASLYIKVVGDRIGAVFGSLVEVPLRPSNKKYQGTNSTFVFTNISSHPVIYRPTGLNRYFTLCNIEFLAIGGGSHFAVYLDGDL
ncbi:hypothetical protein Ahy_A07g036978 isoform A [Arachis hypogaea]|uniref:Oxidation resistance protein 1 n=1 Tax=Arachis hypogaea TaxID=3818 RepID=A0A445CHI4_ARAHY|nr:hypothetical protein Ahy_A07g036978 isoform A [Arachis hypogaea]